MKITIDPDSVFKVTAKKSYGLVSFASFNRIIKGMVASGELQLNAGETISEVNINHQGLAFKIEDGSC